MRLKLTNKLNYKSITFIFIFSLLVSLMFCGFSAYGDNIISDNDNVVNDKQNNVSITATSTESNFAVEYVPIISIPFSDTYDLSTPSTNYFTDTNVSNGYIVINFDVEENWFAMQEGSLMYAISDDDWYDAAMCYFTPLEKIPGKVPVWYINGQRVGEKWTVFNDGPNVFELVYENASPVDLNINVHSFPSTGIDVSPTFKVRTEIDEVPTEYEHLTTYYDAMFSEKLFNYSADYFYVVNNAFIYGYDNVDGGHVRTGLYVEPNELWEFQGWTVNGTYIPNQPNTNIFLDNYLYYNYINDYSKGIEISPVFISKNDVVGHVIDSNSSVDISGANVVIENQLNGLTTQTISDERGFFKFAIEENTPFNIYISEQLHAPVHANFPSGITHDTPIQTISMLPVMTVFGSFEPNKAEGLDYFNLTHYVDGCVVNQGYQDTLNSLLKIGSSYNLNDEGNLNITWINDLVQNNQDYPPANTENMIVVPVAKEGYTFDKWLVNGQEFVPGVIEAGKDVTFSASFVSNVNPNQEENSETLDSAKTGDNENLIYALIFLFVVSCLFILISNAKKINKVFYRK